TIAGLQELLINKLQKFMDKVAPPEIRFISRQRFVFIKGGVSYQGWYRVPVVNTLDELVQSAGGLVENIDIQKVTLKRKTKDGIIQIPIKGKIKLYPSDIIQIPEPPKLKEKIDSGDLLLLRIPSEKNTGVTADAQYRQNQVEVDRFGYLPTPEYGNIYVKKLTIEEVSKTLTDRLPKYLSQSSKAQASIIEKRHYIQVLGHVKNPGWYNLPEMANIEMAINSGGGTLDGAVMNEITIRRYYEDELKHIKVNLFQYAITGDERLLPPLHENDMIFVPISSTVGNIKRTLSPLNPPPATLEKESKRQVQILGAIKDPGVYEPTEKMDLLDLLVKARGETDDADLADVQIIRNNKTLKYNLKQLLLEEKLDIPKIQDGDIVRIAHLEKQGYIKKATRQKIRIIGAVVKPGGYEYIDNMDLIDLIAMADGPHEAADLSKIMLYRDNRVEHFDLEGFFADAAKKRGEAPKVQSGDLVQVSYIKRKDYVNESNIYVLGKVRNSGEFQLKQGMTVIQAISLAGGLDDWADTDNIMIIRMVNGKQLNIPYSFNTGIRGNYPELNARLQAQDVVYVP
ncbi:MAG: SLBB domain-containing protein, partial [Desulfobacterales bacterium]|nr:SLBB domain-containing protein [Desulfobacterales bacterium]